MTEIWALAILFQLISKAKQKKKKCISQNWHLSPRTPKGCWITELKMSVLINQPVSMTSLLQNIFQVSLRILYFTYFLSSFSPLMFNSIESIFKPNTLSRGFYRCCTEEGSGIKGQVHVIPHFGPRKSYYHRPRWSFI